MKSEEYKRNKDKFQKLLSTVSEISKSELAPFLDHKKFLHSTLFHQIAVFAAMHYKEHSNSTPIMQVLDFTKLKGTEYLKAVRWFEYRTGTCFFIEDNKLKKSKSNTLLDENYQMFGEFLKTYKGPLPEIKSQKAEIEEVYIEKYKKYSKEPRDEFDLIENTSMKIGGRTVFGGYGTGKKR
ncbi:MULTISPECIES: hypothetical protein [Acinetobacter]|uniref:hypothetical protein n=1 Tax=Acinetobacter TaxID=469 RepID=UPI0002CFC1D3|nr:MULTISPECIES: hypothetical protein [Acinetobacter]ENU31741.1 hypothetical protein F991_00510 [Acinetobacter sp. CIP-A165]NAR16969.1 hypothetical protein [Acinetobacter haemolyticus]